MFLQLVPPCSAIELCPVVTSGQILVHHLEILRIGMVTHTVGAVLQCHTAAAVPQWHCDSDPPAVAALPSTTWRCHCWSPLLPLCQCHFLNWSLFLILLALQPKGIVMFISPTHQFSGKEINYLLNWSQTTLHLIYRPRSKSLSDLPQNLKRVVQQQLTPIQCQM